MADLAQRSVFLSASFPSGERGELVRPYDPDGIADAVTAIVNAVFASNGRIVFGGHPTITPLVLRMAARRELQDAVDVYQSEHFRDRITKATFELETKGYGHIKWVEEGPSLETSLQELRDKMFSSDVLVGAIFIGGMEGIEEEFRMFGEYRENLPRIPIAGPGGMAARLARDRREELRLPVELLKRLDSRRYPVLAGLIVRLLAEQPQSGLGAESEVLRPHRRLHGPAWTTRRELRMGRMFKVLSIDGGGIRGVIPALVLTELERRTGRPISKLFDLIVGTSTGGIIALGLTRPNELGEPKYSAAQIADLYLREGERIFSRSLWHRIRSVEGLLEEKFQADEVEKVLDEYFGETRLSEALTNIFVTAYEIELRSPWFFRSARAKSEPGHDFPMKKVARATSAAPTYFEPAKLEDGGDVGYWALVDGGVYANNPTLCGLVEARTAFGVDDVFIVSLGTGERTRRIPYGKAKGWGVAGWARPVLDVVFDGVSDTVDFQAQQLCGAVSGRRRYYRYQVELAAAREDWVDDWDDASKVNLDQLRRLTESMIEKRSAELDEMCAALTAEVAAGVP